MEKAFEVLINEHRAMMLAYASSLVGGNSHEAEDIVQEACVAAYKNLDQFDTSRSFPKWLRGIVRFKALDSKRAACRRPMIEDPEVIAGMEDVFEQFDKQHADESWRDRLTLVVQCTRKLPPAMGEVIQLYYQLDLSLKSIAQRLSLKAPTVGQRLSRARKLIRHCVANLSTL